MIALKNTQKDNNMTDLTDEEKRIKLQEQFRNRLKNLNLSKPEGYVSKLSPVVKPEKPIVAQLPTKEIKKKIKEFIEPLGKKMWAPQINKDKSVSVDATCSKYFGNPWMYENEEWPLISGTPSIFVLQLNIETLPKEMSEELGGKGLLQFFYETNDYDSYIVRIVDLTKPGKVLKQPKVEGYKIPKEKIIIDWKEYVDYPHAEDLEEQPGYKELEQLVQGNNLYINELLPNTYQGDKLGGWPFWTQASEGTDGYIYQLDAGSFYGGVKVPAHAPNLFASDGTGHIFIDKDSKEGEFLWACG
jgi:uncharacterized protein YwqG